MDGLDGMVILYTVTPRASLQSDANKFVSADPCCALKYYPAIEACDKVRIPKWKRIGNAFLEQFNQEFGPDDVFMPFFDNTKAFDYGK